MEKKRKSYFWLILSVLFLIFISYYIAYKSGYYEANVSRKTIITEEKKEEFEKDVKEGKEIDLKDYITSDYVDYSSSMSKIGNKLSSSIDSFMENGLSNIFEFLGKLFT